MINVFSHSVEINKFHSQLCNQNSVEKVAETMAYHHVILRSLSTDGSLILCSGCGQTSSDFNSRHVFHCSIQKRAMKH